MKRLLVPLVILLVCVFIVTGCGGTSTSTPTTPATTPAATKPAATTPAQSPDATVTQPPTQTQPATTDPSPTATSSQKYGGTLRYIYITGPNTPIGYPAEAIGSSVSTMQYCLETPLRETVEGKEGPRLALSYEVNPDQSNASLTFHLRKGVKFHDGTDWNAQAMKWNLEKLKEVGFYAFDTTLWHSIEVLDDYTLRIGLDEFRNTQMREMADGMGYMASPASIEKQGLDWMRWNMVGTGPFIQKEFVRDVSFSATRNPNYWDQGKPYLDEVQLLFVADELTRDALFKSGGADILTATLKQASEYKASGYNVIVQQGGVTVLVPDSENADSPWANIKVRQAIEYAIDKASIAKTFGYGFQQPANQLPSPINVAYDPDFQGREFDVAKAQALMVEAGYPNGFKSSLIVDPQANRDAAQAIQAYLAKIGIQLDIQYPQIAKWSEYQTGTWKNALLYTSLLEWPNYNSAIVFFFGVPPGFFKSVSKPDGWKEMYLDSIHTPSPPDWPTGDVEQERKLIKAAFDHAMVIPISYSAATTVTTDKVQDTGLGTRGNSFFFDPAEAWLKK